MNDEEVKKLIQMCVEMCAEVCDSHSRSLSRDNLFVAANEAQKCGSAVRARVGSITSTLMPDDKCWACNGEAYGYGSYCTFCKS